MTRRHLFYLLLFAVCSTTAVNAQWLESSDSLMSDIRAVVSNGSYLFAGAFAGVYRSADNGFNWNPVLNNVDVRDLTVIGSDIYAATSGYGVLRSTDDGAHWVEVDSGLSNHNINCLLSNGSELFAGSNGAVQRSTDNGAYWGPSDASISGADINTMTFNGSDLFAGTSGSAVYFSTNDGASWTMAGNSFNASVGDLESVGSHLFAATVSGVFRTTDNGQNWSLVNTGMTGLQAAALAVSGSTLFAGTFGGGIYRSTDEGGTWSAVNAGLTYFNIDCLYSHGGYLYAGTGGSIGSIWRRPLSELTSVDRSSPDMPLLYALEQNYPDPFNPSTKIRYGLPSKSHVTLAVYNTLGQQVALLINGEQEAGYHEVRFDASGLASGAYLYRIQAGSFVQTKKLLLLR